MSDFELEEWEEAAFVSSDAALPLEETDVFVLACVPIRRKSWVVLGREKKNTRSGNWILLIPDSDEPRLWSPRPPTFQLKKLLEQWPHSEKGRLFAWPQERCVLRSNGEGAWLDAHGRVDVQFDVSFEPEVWNDALLLWDKVQQERAAPDSDMNFAAYWRKSGGQKWSLFFEEEEHYTTLLQVAETVLWEFGDQMNWIESNWRVSHAAPGGAYVNSLIGGTMKHSERLERLLSSWSHFFAFEFLPAATQKARQRHRCLELFFHKGTSFIEVDLSRQPTQHERIEARLRLREWLERNAPNEVERLLPK
jgi:hypothetical protein